MIREAVASDAAQVMSLARHVTEYFDEYHVNTREEFRSDVDFWAKMITRHSDADNDLFIVAQCDEEIIGVCDFSSMRRQRLSHWGAFAINIRNDFHGLGIGRYLLTTILDWAQNNPAIETVTLKVHANNSRAIHLYESLGFLQAGILPGAVKYSEGVYVDAIEMYRHVKKTNV